MTQKRKHYLERRVRIYYKQFETVWCSFIDSKRLLKQITILMNSRINYFSVVNIISLTEEHFMRECVIKYNSYYFKKQLKMHSFS